MPSTDLQQAIAEMFSGGVYDLENEIVRAIVTTDPDQQVLCMYRIPTPLLTGYPDQLSIAKFVYGKTTKPRLSRKHIKEDISLLFKYNFSK